MFAVFICIASLVVGNYVAGQQEGDIRLGGTGANAREGRVEYFTGGTWGTICRVVLMASSASSSTNVHVNNGRVICKQLGFEEPGDFVRLTGGYELNPDNAPMHITALTCDGVESRVQDCRLSSTAVGACDPNTPANDAIIRCTGNLRSATATTRRPNFEPLPPVDCGTVSSLVRLEGSSNNYEGRVMLNRSGEWRAICDDGWDQADARVVCRMLCSGNVTYAAAVIGRYRPPNNLTMWTSNVACTGDEQSIGDCPHNGWDNHNCQPFELAGVRCSPPPDPLPQVPEPEITCPGDSIVARFNVTDFPMIGPEHIKLTNGYNESCGFRVVNDTSLINIIIATIPLTDCGTELLANASHLYYRNMVDQLIADTGTIIVRTQVYHIPVICITPRYHTVKPEPLNPVLRPAKPVDGPLTIPAEITYNKNGQPVPPGSQITMPERINMVVTANATDSNLKMVVLRCWTTNGQNGTSYTLFRQKCAEDPTVIPETVNNLEFSINYETFVFKDPAEGMQYTGCDYFMCRVDEKNANCDQTCTRARRRRAIESSPDAMQTAAIGIMVDRPSGPGWEVVVYKDTIIRYRKNGAGEVTERRPDMNGMTNSTVVSATTRETPKMVNITQKVRPTTQLPQKTSSSHGQESIRDQQQQDGRDSPTTRTARLESLFQKVAENPDKINSSGMWFMNDKQISGTSKMATSLLLPVALVLITLFADSAWS